MFSKKMYRDFDLDDYIIKYAFNRTNVVVKHLVKNIVCVVCSLVSCSIFQFFRWIFICTALQLRNAYISLNK